MNPLSANGAVYYLRAFFGRLFSRDKAPATNPSHANNVFYVRNLSKLVKDDDVKAMCAAIQIQLMRDVKPAWKLDHNFAVVFVKDDPGVPCVHLIDDWGKFLTYEMFGGRHADGRIEVNVKKCLNAHPGHVSMTLSHELIEGAVSPGSTTGPYAGICNKYQAVDYAYFVNGVMVSNLQRPGGSAFR